jgi:hypothetical protein
VSTSIDRPSHFSLINRSHGTTCLRHGRRGSWRTALWSGAGCASVEELDLRVSTMVMMDDHSLIGIRGVGGEWDVRRRLLYSLGLGHFMNKTIEAPRSRFIR